MKGNVMGVRKMRDVKYESGTSTLAFSGKSESAFKVMIKVLACALVVVSSLGVLVAAFGV